MQADLTNSRTMKEALCTRVGPLNRKPRRLRRTRFVELGGNREQLRRIRRVAEAGRTFEPAPVVEAEVLPGGMRLAPALDVRAALALVESDPEILGIVYRTDAMTSEKVRVLCVFPPLDDAPIIYSAALIADGDNPELGRRFLDFLTSPPAREIAERHGFTAAER